MSDDGWLRLKPGARVEELPREPHETSYYYMRGVRPDGSRRTQRYRRALRRLKRFFLVIHNDRLDAMLGFTVPTIEARIAEHEVTVND